MSDNEIPHAWAVAIGRVWLDDGMWTWIERDGPRAYRFCSLAKSGSRVERKYDIKNSASMQSAQDELDAIAIESGATEETRR